MAMVGTNNLTNELLALDFEEHKKTGKIISFDNAALFVQRIYEKTGRYPFLYCNRANMELLSKSIHKSLFSKCPLWIISLQKDGNISHLFNEHDIWKSYTLWQFSCEINCCSQNNNIPCFYKVMGLECGIDYNIYNGTCSDLIEHWNK